MPHSPTATRAGVFAIALTAALAITAWLAFSALSPVEAAHDPQSVNLVAGANLVVYNGATLPVTDALNTIDEITIAVWRFDALTQQWQAWTTALPESLRGFSELEHGRAYFIITSAAALWQFPEADALPSRPPALSLLVGDQTVEATRGSFCWPVEPGVGICADTFFPTFDTFIPVPDDQVLLTIDAPTPDTVALSLLTPDGLAPLDGDTTRIDNPDRSITWTPSIAAGDYILSVFATWASVGGQGGDASYLIPITLSGINAPFARQLVPAPIESAEIIVAESFPPQYFAQIVSAQPNGCVEFDSFDLTRDGATIRIDIWNSAPVPTADIACTLVFRTTNHNVALGSDFEPGVEYTVQINDVTRTFVAQ